MLHSFGMGCLMLATLPFSMAIAAESLGRSQEASAVLEKTKSTSSTYSAYYWNRITLPNKEPVEEWSAEFHSGNMHRVETPKDRVIADCRAKTGTVLNIVSGEVMEGPQVANAACGINTNFAITQIESLGTVRSAFGKLQRVRVADSQNIRQYDVSGDGVLLAATYSENRTDGHTLLSMKAVKLERELPARDMFDRSSLQRSFVSEDYKRAPAH
mgnify:CR=1 FL=1